MYFSWFSILVLADHRIVKHLIFLQVEIDEASGLPTDQLTDVAVAECCHVGSSALTVSDILGNGGDTRVLRMIQKGIDSVNKKAPSRAQKVQV